ncbi:hypothetical protein [Butyrivibrio sp. AE2015]|uniref:hypothetical protein n=1 Tax=Butyrivibrio sp. AE2015 TaxID=1280663 RepID=UPI0003B78B99|nr:hypothetical protein [Butyrivibrio sp. AE2015]
MQMVFTTLFDSYYLDKGLVLYRSLERVTDNFTLYIYTFDQKAFDVLSSLNLKHAVILSNTDLEKEYPILLKLKKERSKAEYCWTCTPASIEYILNHFDVDNCTYIDSDLYFFSDPQILLDEIKDADANIVITPHRFSNSLKDRRYKKRSGDYCVEFNYFDNSENAKEALAWWKERCFEWCFHIYEKDRMGDQKYLMKFPQLFKGVHELEHLGGGTAPWNLAQYEYTGKMTNQKAPVMKEKSTGKEFPVVFYHFQSMRYVNKDFIIVRSETNSKKTKDILYRPYLIEIESIRKELERDFGITFYVAQSYASNPIIKFVQKYILRFKMKSFSDLYDLRKLR